MSMYLVYRADRDIAIELKYSWFEMVKIKTLQKKTKTLLHLTNLFVIVTLIQLHFFDINMQNDKSWRTIYLHDR